MFHFWFFLLFSVILFEWIKKMKVRSHLKKKKISCHFAVALFVDILRNVVCLNLYCVHFVLMSVLSILLGSITIMVINRHFWNTSCTCSALYIFSKCGCFVYIFFIFNRNSIMWQKYWDTLVYCLVPCLLSSLFHCTSTMML